MKSLAEINAILAAFEGKFGYAIGGAEQQSEAWFNAKLGVISASRASEVVAKKDSGTRLTYMADLIAQICTGLHKDIKVVAMDWGNQNEDGARAYYEFSKGVTVTQLPFVFKDTTYRIGCSPDGYVNDRKGYEIKCPFDTANYIKFFMADKIDTDWQWQNQFNMWVLGAEQWDFSMYDPRMCKSPMRTITIDKDEEKHKKFDELIPEFIHDMDKVLAKIGVEFGDQWRRLHASSGEAP